MSIFATPTTYLITNYTATNYDVRPATVFGIFGQFLFILCLFHDITACHVVFCHEFCLVCCSVSFIFESDNITHFSVYSTTCFCQTTNKL
jgi:hypothetical protein